jgi:hypothetical protein
MKETELAQHFVKYLSCYDLYFEIPRLHVDIVAKHGNILMAFEVKTNLNFRVIEQAIDNKIYFHYSYICVPTGRNQDMAKRICSDYGIGILSVTVAGNYVWGDVMEWVHPSFNRKALTKYVSLPEFSKCSIPGATGGDGTTITPFKNTINSIVKYLRRNNGAPFDKVYDNIETHYNNLTAAKSSLYQWIRKGVIKEFYFDRGKLYLNNLLTDDQKTT